MKKRAAAMLLAGILGVINMSGCSRVAVLQQTEGELLDPNNPVTLTVWHYYNGAQQAAFDTLVAKFNTTVGKEKGIYVKGYSQGSVSDLEAELTDAVAEKVGSQELPDIFSTYADTAYAIQKQGKLTDLTEYFSEEELSEYVEAYIEEGYFGEDGGLYLFPVAKATEIMMVNATAWNEFSRATGISTDELAISENLIKTAERYYEWTDSLTPEIPDDGKAFYGRDSMSNYFIIGMKQMGVDLFEVQDGKVTVCAEKDKMRRLWENYYVPYIKGYFKSIGKFRSDDVKTGDILVYTGSLSSSAYFPDHVVLDDGSEPIDYIVLPPPTVKGGSAVNVQQGASMAVTKSNEKKEYAACEFLRWLTEKENNLQFVCESGYLPVKKEANSVEALDQVIKEENLKVSPKTYDSLVKVLGNYESLTFYMPKCFENGYASRRILDVNLSERAKADRGAVEAAIASGVSREEALVPYLTEEAFEAWYHEIVDALNENAY